MNTRSTHHKRSAVRDLTMLLILMLTGWLLALIIEIAQIQDANAAYMGGSAELPHRARVCADPRRSDWAQEVMAGCTEACRNDGGVCDACDQCRAEFMDSFAPAAGQDEIDLTIKGDME